MAEVGYVGLGVMGSSVTRRLLEAGHLQDPPPPQREPLPGDPVQPSEELDVLLHRQIAVERELLRHVADAPARGG